MSDHLSFSLRKDLILACEKGHFEKVKKLVTEYNVNFKFNNYAPFRIAREKGYIKIVKFLYLYNKNFNFVIAEQELRFAARNNQFEIVKFFVEQGVNIHHANNSTLNLACQAGNLDIVKYLIDQGANYHKGYETPLLLAVLEGRLNIVKYLVEKGCNINTNNNELFKIAKKNKRTEILKYLKIANFMKNINC
jgi:ankyrin repeat protein